MWRLSVAGMDGVTWKGIESGFSEIRAVLAKSQQGTRDLSPITTRQWRLLTS